MSSFENMFSYTVFMSVTWHKTGISPVCQLWRYHSFVLSNWYSVCCDNEKLHHQFQTFDFATFHSSNNKWFVVMYSMGENVTVYVVHCVANDLYVYLMCNGLVCCGCHENCALFEQYPV